MSETTSRVTRRKNRRWPFLVVTTVIVTFLVEVGLRLSLGLGTPVLAELDPEIEYLLKPNQNVRRFGQRTTTNAFGMRSRDIPTKRSDPNELRILVLGDSVVNGGVLTDHNALATTILESRLAAAWGRPVFVGNISAGSWGPPNHHAYLQRFGWFDADLVILVVSSTDAADDRAPSPRTWAPLPTSAPWSAISELVSRYILPRLTGGELPAPASADRLDEPEAIAACKRSLLAIIDEASARGTPIVMLQHWELPEIEAGSPRAGHELLAAIADERGVPRVQLGNRLRQSPEPRAFFRDHIHLNDKGQAMLADALESIVISSSPWR